MEPEVIRVVSRAVKEEEAVFVKREKNAGLKKSSMLGLGDGDGETLKFAGELPDFRGVECLAELLAEDATFFAVGDENRFGVIVDEAEVFGALLE